MKTLHKIFIGTGLATCVLGVGFAVSYGVYQDKCLQVAKAVSYDDSNYKIDLSYIESSTYVFNNFFDYLANNDSSLQSIYLNFEQGFEIDSMYTIGNIYIDDYDVDDYFAFTYSDTQNNNRLNVSCNFYIDNPVFIFQYSIENDISGILAEGELDNYTHLYICSNATYYTGLKNAIELDIRTNTPSQYTYLDFLTESIGLLVGAIVPTASGIGGGLSTLVNALSISNNGMSPFTAVIFIFGGISLAFALSRWAVNLISSFGQRNR